MAPMKGTPGPKERAEPLPKSGPSCCSSSVGQLINNEARKGFGGPGLTLSQGNKEGIQEPHLFWYGEGDSLFLEGATGLS